MTIPYVSGPSGLNPEELLEQIDQGEIEAKRAKKIKRQTHFEKRMAALDEHIGALKERQSKLFKGALFGFVMNLFAQAVKALDFLVPGLGTALGTIAGGLGEVFNPFRRAAGKLELKAEELKKNAEREQQWLQVAGEQVSESESHRQTMARRLEKALDDFQKSKEAMVRV